MPISQLSVAERERLSGFPSDEVSLEDLRLFFGLTAADRVLVFDRRGDENRLGLAVQLGCVRFLGIVPDLDRVPVNVVDFVGREIGVVGPFGRYGERDQTRSDHLGLVLDHLGFVAIADVHTKRLQAWLLDRAAEHVGAVVLFEQAAGWLRAEGVLRPAVSALERLIAGAVTEADREMYRVFDVIVTAPRRAVLDELLVVMDSGESRVTWLLRGTSGVSPRGVLAGLARVEFLRDLRIAEWDMSGVGANRLRQLARVARTASVQYLARLPDHRRYAVLLAFASLAVADLADETLDVFCSALGQATSRTRRAHRDEIEAHSGQLRTDWARLVRLAEMVLDAADSGTNPVEEIDVVLGLETIAEVAARGRTTPLAADRFFDHLERRHNWMRRFAPAVLERFDFEARVSDPDVVAAIAVLNELNRSGRRKPPDDASTDFLPSRMAGSGATR